MMEEISCVFMIRDDVVVVDVVGGDTFGLLLLGSRPPHHQQCKDICVVKTFSKDDGYREVYVLFHLLIDLVCVRGEI